MSGLTIVAAFPLLTIPLFDRFGPSRPVFDRSKSEQTPRVGSGLDPRSPSSMLELHVQLIILDRNARDALERGTNICVLVQWLRQRAPGEFL